jgi:cyclohexanecarboxylate-CoA ligase
MDSNLKSTYYQQGYWRHETLWETLLPAMAASPQAIAFIDGDRKIDYSALLSDAARFAGALRAHGIRSGETVLIHGRNAIETATAMLGCWRQGFVAIPVPPMFSAAQLGSILRNSSARVLVSAAEGEALQQAAQAATEENVALFVTPDGSAGSMAWSELLRMGSNPPPPAPSASDELAVLIYSSGTTGTPKGVMHSSNTIRFTVEQIASLHTIDASDTILIACQFGFIGSVVFGILLTLATGATGVLVGRWNADQALQLIPLHKVTYTLLMPTHIIDLLTAPLLEQTDCSSLRRGILAGITSEQRARATTLLCALPFPMFGMSECAGQTTCSAGDDADKRATTDGKPLAGAETRIVDDDGEPVPPGTKGHVMVRGPSRFLGYFAAPDLTREVLNDDGFFRTGDLGVVDHSGFFTFGSRARDVIRRGGVTIVPSEIEEGLRKHPMVRDAAIIGVPDERLGERSCVCIIAKATPAPTLESLNDELGKLGISQYLWPEFLLLFDEFPRTPSLKVKKFELRQVVLTRLEQARAAVL